MLTHTVGLVLMLVRGTMTNLLRTLGRTAQDWNAVKGNRYVVPHTLVSRQLVGRVKDTTLRVFDADTLVVTYAMTEGRGHRTRGSTKHCGRIGR